MWHYEFTDSHCTFILLQCFHVYIYQLSENSWHLSYHIQKAFTLKEKRMTVIRRD